jgi:PAS domain S-box-containing protein
MNAIPAPDAPVTPFREVLPLEQDRAILRAALLEALAFPAPGETPEEVEARCERILQDFLVGRDPNTPETRTLLLNARSLIGAGGVRLREIARLRESEHLRAESEQRLRQIVENLPAGAVYFEGDRVYLNRATEEITGYPRETFTYISDWLTVLFGEKAVEMLGDYERERAEGFPNKPIVPLRRRDGEIRLVEFAAVAGPSGDICLLHDVTERERSRVMEEKEKVILEMITGTATLDEVLTTVAGLIEASLPDVSAELRLTEPGEEVSLEPSYTPELWIQPIVHGCGAFGLVLARPCTPRLPAAFEQHLLHMSSRASELAIQRRRADEHLRRAKDELEARVEERTAELERERARLEAILQQMPAGVLIADTQTGQVHLMNDQIARMWRWEDWLDEHDTKKASLTLDTLEMEKPDGTLYTVDDLPLQALRHGIAIQDVEVPIRRCDGTRGILLASAAPVHSPHGGESHTVVVTLKDITDLKNTEEALRRLHDELELQVQERTAELAQANLSLQEEVLQRRRAEQVSRGQASALTRTLNALLKSTDPEAVRDQVLQAIGEQLGADGLTFLLHDPETDCLTIYAVHLDGKKVGRDFLESVGVSTHMPTSAFPKWKTLRQGLPVLVRDIAAEADMPQGRDAMLQIGLTTLLGIPLMLGGQVIGCFSVSTRQQRDYTNEEIERAQSLAHYMTLAVQLERLTQRERSSAVLAERNRMAREIHDTLAQGFTSIIIHLQLAEAAMQRKPEKALPTLLKARDIAKESLAEARRSVWALRPNALEGNNLADGLRRMVTSLSASASVQPKVEVEGSPRALPAETESHLLRLGQEALNNSLKYAEADEITVSVSFGPDYVKVCVRDNGRGFDPIAKPRGSGFGLVGMRERVTALRGELCVETALGEGTVITVTVPA